VLESDTNRMTGETETRHLTIRGREFRFYVPKTLDSFVDPEDVFRDFPLWAKIWEASIILADHLAGMSPEPGKRFLEIGAGLGVVGVVAAAFGHRMTVTEINPDAVRFARANAKLNLHAGESLPEMKRLDWNRPGSEQAYDYIVGNQHGVFQGNGEGLPAEVRKKNPAFKNGGHIRHSLPYAA